MLPVHLPKAEATNQKGNLMNASSSTVALDITPAELHYLKSAVESFSHGFGHDQADVRSALRPLLHKVAALHASVARSH